MFDFKNFLNLSLSLQTWNTINYWFFKRIETIENTSQQKDYFSDEGTLQVLQLYAK